MSDYDTKLLEVLTLVIEHTVLQTLTPLQLISQRHSP